MAAKTEADLSKKITRGEFSMPSTVKLSSHLKRLLKKILNPSLEKRPTASEILIDEWFVGEPEEES